MRLEIEGKTYIAPKAKGRMFRKALVLAKTLQVDELEPETLDELLQFVVEIFGEKFDIDAIYDSVDSEELLPLVMLAIEHVQGGFKEVENKKKITE